MPFVVDAASVYAGQYHFLAKLVVQIDAGLNAAKRPRYVVHDIVDQLIEVENGIDLLRGLLHFLQFFNLVEAKRLNGEVFRADSSWNGGQVPSFTQCRTA